MLELFDLLNDKSAIILSDLFNYKELHDKKINAIFQNATSKDQVILYLIEIIDRSENFRKELVDKLKIYILSRTNIITESYFKELVKIDEDFFKLINDDRKVECILSNSMLLSLASHSVIDKLLVQNNTNIHYKIYQKLENEKNLAYACMYFIDKMSEDNLLSVYRLILDPKLPSSESNLQTNKKINLDILPMLKVALGRGFINLTEYFIDLLENEIVYIFHPIKNEILLTAIEENKYKIIKWHCEHGFIDGIWNGIQMAAKLKNRKILNLLMAYVS